MHLLLLHGIGAYNILTRPNLKEGLFWLLRMGILQRRVLEVLRNGKPDYGKERCNWKNPICQGIDIKNVSLI